ncbi:uncharacterized protein LOC114303668 [Camellia sinensis]|uniref:uncharacterized protein LOC114303668 n=1 Tax=Camellia sinensis TaxID=4442 RepID=UPI00103579AC|nr:uncharacterized protein LOC114303668 [Camellia sinensis]
MALLQETKRSQIDVEFERSCWYEDRMDFMAVDLVGVAGGLLCIWNPDAFQMVDCCCKPQFHHFVRNISERNGCYRRDRGIRDFNDFIDNLEVCDMHMMGRKFTWCNSQEGERWSRIDRFLLTPEWVQNFNFKLWGLPRRWSDHCPILLMEDDREWGPKPFRFLNAWSLHPQFKSLVDNTWAETIVQGWVGFKCLRKLKALKLVLKQWNIEVFGNVESKLKLLEWELHLLDLTAEDRPLTVLELARRREAKGEVWKLTKMVEGVWFQKSRVNWALKGDKNTKFFHILAASRNSRNALCSLNVNGTIKEDPEEIRAEMLQHFRN